jgi:ABC-2 type transport system permease protein
VINALRAELLKMRSMPGVWVSFGLAFPLTILLVLAVLASAGGFPGHTFYFVSSLRERRELLGSGYFGIEVLAPVIGVLCVTSEYRHKTITTSLVLVPVRSRVLLAKVITVAIWAVLLAALSLAAVFLVGLPWNAALGGATSQVTDQVGAVVPGLVASAVLLGLFGLGFGTLVKNQVAAILLTIGGTLILEGILEVWPGPSSTTTSTGSPTRPAPRWPGTSPGASAAAAVGTGSRQASVSSPGGRAGWSCWAGAWCP